MPLVLFLYIRHYPALAPQQPRGATAAIRQPVVGDKLSSLDRVVRPVEMQLQDLSASAATCRRQARFLPRSSLVLEGKSSCAYNLSMRHIRQYKRLASPQCVENMTFAIS
jgi:hypothetical protein